MTDTTFTINSTVKRAYPRLPYKQMKDDVLGTSSSVSLVFIGADRARRLNQTYRNKSYVPNVLSFPLDATHYEIYIVPAIAKREAKKRNMSTRGYIGFLFIHGLLHLKGLKHGDTMEQAEKHYTAKYSLA